MAEMRTKIKNTTNREDGNRKRALAQVTCVFASLLFDIGHGEFTIAGSPNIFCWAVKAD
jgi:hypothetical protein